MAMHLLIIFVSNLLLRFHSKYCQGRAVVVVDKWSACSPSALKNKFKSH